jgi:lysozyme
MKLSEKGIEILHHFESCSLKPYLCPAKIPTIGWGNTFYADGTKVTMKDKPITQEQADELSKLIINQFEIKVKKLLTANLTDYQYSAILCFTYNVGTGSLQKSTLLKKVNINPNDPTIPSEFLKWNKSGSTVLKGLTRRRQSEAHLYKHNEVNFYNI